MNITKILEKTESFEIEYNGEKVKFDAKTAGWTPKLLKNYETAEDLPKTVMEVVSNWDVTADNKGTKWPLTEDKLAELPIPFLDAILTKVSESWAGDKKKPQNAQNGSAVAASSANP